MKQREQALIEQLKASNRVIELLVECYITGKRLSRVEVLQCQVCTDDNKAMIEYQEVSV